MSTTALIENFTTDLKIEPIQNIFMPQKDVDYFNWVASQFMQRVQGQSVLFIKIDKETTQSNFYGESKNKRVQGDPIRLPASVSEIVTPINDETGIRFKKQLRVGFLQKLNE